MKKLLFILIPLILLVLVSSTWAEKSKPPVASEPQDEIQIDKSKPAPVPTTPGNVQDKAEDITPKSQKSAAPNYDLSWFSINGGGDSYGSSTNYQLGYSVGQPVAGQGSSASYDLGIGFWYGAYTLCTAIPGDVNGSSAITIGDIVHLVNYIFDKDRLPCLGSDPGNCWTPAPFCRGDVNQSATITIGDILHLVNYIFDKDRLPCLGASPGNCWTPESSEACCLPVP
ncbi:MAG: hypothetical protein A2142_06025 [candidate division Zixibacteria bacterium RBG_16_48_11]|nr:MAG: hypothetical protein A2142_06025 [candidate division Zixibacteria bacterium RBG_16_48_11]